MRIERFSFKEFGDDVQAAAASKAAVSAQTKAFLPAGSSRAAVPPPPPPPPVYKEEDLKSAEREGYKKGFLEGTKEGHAQAQSEHSRIEEQLMQHSERFASHLAPLFAEYRTMCLQLQQDVPKLALTIAKKVAGSALSENAAAVIEDMASHACETMIEEPGLTVTVHQSMVSVLEQKLKTLSERQRAAADITVIGNPDMPMADCRVEWKHGALARDTARLWQQIESAVDAIAAGGTRDTKAKLDTLQSNIPTEDNTPGAEIV